jgi:segregation and condensation protein B
MIDDDDPSAAGSDDGAGLPKTLSNLDTEAERIAEALVFSAAGPVSEAMIADRLPKGVNVRAIMMRLKQHYATRGVHLHEFDGHWAFRTASDLSFALHQGEQEIRKLSRAALEVLAIIAYHQPVTRAEIEEIRGVQTSKGTLDVLLEARWVRLRGRRRTPGRPVTFGTTPDFLDHFSLEDVRDLPGLEELKGAGLLSGRIPANFNIPVPGMDDHLAEDEDPITTMDLEDLGLLTPGGELDEEGHV